MINILLLLLLLRLTVIFPVGPGSAGISGTEFLWVRCPFCNPTFSIQALNKALNITILSLSTAGFLAEGALNPLCWLPDA